MSQSFSVNKFLSFNDYKVMEGKGRMTKIQADKKTLPRMKDSIKPKK